jgi:integrase
MAEGPPHSQRIRYPQVPAASPPLRGAGEAHRRDPASLVPNPEPKRTEVQTFSLDELDAISAELSPTFRAVPVFAALTGLRPCEWMALEQANVDRKGGVVIVRRTVVEGSSSLTASKTDRSLRAVPLPARAAQALDEHPTRLDTRVLFPGTRGRPPALSPWRHREWNPALRAAGLAHRTVYAMRHTYACSHGSRRVRLGTEWALDRSGRRVEPYGRAGFSRGAEIRTRDL